MISSKNVSSDTQVKNFFVIYQKVTFSKYSFFVIYSAANKYYSSASHHEQQNQTTVKLNFWQSQRVKLVLTSFLV